MIPVQKIVQAYKSNMNFNTREDAFSKRLDTTVASSNKNNFNETKKKFESILEKAMKKN